MSRCLPAVPNLAVLLLAALGLSCAHGPRDEVQLVRRITADGEQTPWTHLEFADDPAEFQFLIVTDRTGGHRPGVFPEALRKAELLRPEFILSVGDLIEGYSEDRARVEEEWDEFEGFFEGLDIPFFYVGGNHDLSNEVMAEIWRERFGPSYYHFVYRSVLFLCANSEDGQPNRISPEQVDYFRRALEENADARWTLLFLHKPLWVYEAEEAPGWAELEELLMGRDYTVFAGHFHQYRKHVRRDRRYFVLATCGGVSSLRGPDRGEFDHVVWATMTDEGPRVSNLMLDGIWDEDVFTERSAELVRQLVDLRVTPRLCRPDGSLLAEAGFRLSNEEAIPMRVVARAEDHSGLAEPWHAEPWVLKTEVPPDSVMMFALPVAASPRTGAGGVRRTGVGEAPDGAPLALSVTTGFELEDHRPLEFEHDFRLEVGAVRELPERPTGLVVDGDLSDWAALKFEVADTGSAGRARFGLAMGDSMLYLGVRAEDDRVIHVDDDVPRWHHDHVEVRIDTRPFAERRLIHSQWDLRTYVFLALFPAREEESEQMWERANYPEALRMAQRTIRGGYEMELAVPIAYLAERGDVERLEGFSFNLTLIDWDDPEGEERTASWQTPWHLEEAAVGAGGFEVR
ncbi:MAG: hypothetical protein GF330_07295 [Candidatus Eisenbacteria bacterium]|nr:hypothetical protein [Candidatus Eisenbacteria bacterium]